MSHLDGRWEGIRDQRHGDDRSRQQADRRGHGELEPVVFTHGAQLQVCSSVMAPAEADTHPPFGVMLIAVKQPGASKPRPVLHHKQAVSRLCDRVLHRSKRLSVADSNIDALQHPYACSAFSEVGAGVYKDLSRAIQADQ